MSIPNIIFILLTGIAAGFINVLAGGGSLLTMPVLIFMGLPSAVANGTNRIALMIQNIVAITNFKRKGFFNWHLSLMLGIPAVLGSIVGAHLAISLSDEIFNRILAVIMLVVLCLILWNPLKKGTNNLENSQKFTLKKKILAVIVFFFVGIYGGFIQAGVGFIIIMALTLITGMSLVRINSIKVFIIGFYMISSLLIFIINGQINWILGLTLAVGNGIGGWLGSNFAVAKGDKWIRIFLIISVTIMALKLLGLFEIMGL